MTRLPVASGRQVIRALERAGFIVVRSRGSHHFLRHQTDPTRRAIVPVHAGDLPPGTLADILKQARISRADFLELL